MHCFSFDFAAAARIVATVVSQHPIGNVSRLVFWNGTAVLANLSILVA